MKQETLITWKLPVHSCVQLNVDGSARGQLGMVVAGRVIRDEMGNWQLG